MKNQKKPMKPKSGLIKAVVLDERILTIRGQKVILDADLAEVYGVSTKALNQAIKRNEERFPGDFSFLLNSAEKTEVVTSCDHLSRLRFSAVLPRAFTEHGAIMAATILNSPQGVAMSVYVIRAFVKMREETAANAVILRRLAEIDKTLLIHDTALREIVQKLRPLLEPPPQPPKPEIGFHIKEDAFPYRVTKRNRSMNNFRRGAKNARGKD